MVGGVKRIFFSGRLGVEFFFLVSGYLMMATICRIRSQNSSPNIPRETEKFFLRKFKSLYPMVVIAFFMTVICRCLAGLSAEKTIKYMVEGLPNLLLLVQTGVEFYPINGTWYLSSMLLAILLLFPLTLRYYDFMRRIGAGLIALLLTGYLMQNTNGLSSPSLMLGTLTYRGNYRALAELALGMLCYEGAQGLCHIPFTNLGRRFLGLLEFLLYGISMVYMIFCNSSPYDFYILFLLAGAVTLSFSQCHYQEQLWNHPVFSLFGKASLYLYLAHMSSRYLTPVLVDNQGDKVRMIVYVSLAFLLAAFLWLFSELWERCSHHMHCLFVEKTEG